MQLKETLPRRTRGAAPAPELAGAVDGELFDDLVPRRLEAEHLRAQRTKSARSQSPTSGEDSRGGRARRRDGTRARARTRRAGAAPASTSCRRGSSSSRPSDSTRSSSSCMSAALSPCAKPAAPLSVVQDMHHNSDARTSTSAREAPVVPSRATRGARAPLFPARRRLPARGAHRAGRPSCLQRARGNAPAGGRAGLTRLPVERDLVPQPALRGLLGSGGDALLRLKAPPAAARAVRLDRGDRWQPREARAGGGRGAG